MTKSLMQPLLAYSGFDLSFELLACIPTIGGKRPKHAGQLPSFIVAVKSQAPFQVQSRAQAPTPAFNLRQAFAFGRYDLAQRQAAKRTGQ